MAREEIAEVRAARCVATLEDVAACVRARVDVLNRPRLAPVINGTGVILHTNLGRAPVSSETASAMSEAAAAYVPLEIDPDSNARGGRMREITELMRLLTGAERTLVVNNNAGALLLTLASLAGDREVIVARGEAVEIGGGFRVPEVVAQGGCQLVDVGTTNKTRPSDYVAANGPNTGALLKVHPSNFVVDGFTAESTVAELSAIGRRADVPFVHDIGGGSLIDPTIFGLRAEPTFQSSLNDGTDVVTASGDKLLGGPQAGLICGRADLIETIERHPLARGLRADKSTLAGVSATLRHYLSGNAIERVPIWRMISASIDQLATRAARMSADTGWDVAEMYSTVGGGSLPGEEIASVGLAWGQDVDETATRLRNGNPRVFGRIHENRMMIDLRTVNPDQDAPLSTLLREITTSEGGRTDR